MVMAVSDYAPVGDLTTEIGVSRRWVCSRRGGRRDVAVVT
jgi:hypothetical protein